MVQAADATLLLPARLPSPPPGRTVVVGAGKAAAAMARAVEDAWPRDLSGLVITRYGHGVPCGRIDVVEAGHPLPDEAGAQAAARMLALVEGLSVDDLVLVLLSGGGSALLTLPAPGLSLADLRETSRLLLASGARIDEVNCVRKHLSAIAGGRLAAACHPARVVTFAVSDVPGDDPAVIASGPTVPDPTTFAEARAVVARYRLRLPDPVLRHLAAAREETLKPGDPLLARGEFIMLATPESALGAVARAAEAAGVTAVVLGADLQDEARRLGAAHARLTLRLAFDRDRPLLLLSGGETSVIVKGQGRGGRNIEYLAGFALALSEAGQDPPPVFALAADTDGIDGTEDNAGAFLAPDSLTRAAAAGLDVRRLLDDNDSYGLFAGLGDLLVTGPTRTNVNDFRAIMVL
jgi:hydroxypyruvate reductase